jgi:hypothetical protein
MLKAIEFLRHADLQSKGIAPGGTSEADILREFSVKMLSI